MSEHVLTRLGHITQIMWQKGWNEYNGGNISVRMSAEEVSAFGSALQAGTEVPLDFDAGSLAGEYFLCTGTGKFFLHIQEAPEENLAMIRITDDGHSYTRYWGRAQPTSEISTHLLGHKVRKALSGGKERVIMHCHQPNMIALSFKLPPTDRAFSNHLWMPMPECALLFPEGVGVVPYFTPGTVEIGKSTAQKMQDFRVIMWYRHGTFVSHSDLDSGFGLLEAVEKSAQIVLKIMAVGGELAPVSAFEMKKLGDRYGFVFNTVLLEQ